MRYVLLAFCALIVITGLPHGATAASPEVAKKVDQLKQTAYELLTQGKYNKAIPLLKEVLSINPSDKTAVRQLMIARQQIVEPLCKQASDAYFQNNYRKAIEHWENALKINPDDRRITDLIETTKNLLQDNTIEKLYALVDQLLKEGKYPQAISELEKILLLSPEEKKAEEMLKSASKAITDRDLKALYEKADAFMKQKRYDLAIEAWREILKIDKDQEAASRLLATTIRTTFLDSAYSKAEKLYIEGDYSSSLAQFNKILLDNPTDQFTRKIIGRIDDVLKITPKVGRQDEVSDMIRKSLANYISVDGSHRVALAAAWYAVQLAPDNTIALAVRDFLEHELITVVRTMEYPVRDMNIIDQYLFAALNNIYGGRYDLAIQECSLVLELQPGNILALKRLGSGYFAMKNKDKAREVWERALKLAPGDAELKKFISQAK